MVEVRYSEVTEPDALPYSVEVLYADVVLLRGHFAKRSEMFAFVANHLAKLGGGAIKAGEDARGLEARWLRVETVTEEWGDICGATKTFSSNIATDKSKE